MARPNGAVGPITLDSRKFLGAINSSLQSKIASMEQRVRELGRQAGVNWRLVSLNGSNLFIEDADTHAYYGATYRYEKGGNVTIENVRPLRIVESKKRTLFEANCKQLLDALESNDQRAMGTAFNKMAAQRFSSRTIPFSGLVRTHDNITRLVPLAIDGVVDESIRPRLVAAIVEGLTDKVMLHEGIPVSGTFVGRKINLPISEWLCRKAVARHMRRIAEDAYWSPGFQARVYDAARLIYEDKVEDAVILVSKFLADNQEFTLLNRNQTKQLVENALATRACFNQQLCTDTATLFWRTNLKVNRETIIKEWRATARKASHPTLLENVTILEQSPNFEAAYDKFINLVFNEAVGPRDVQVHAYKTALQALKGTPKIKDSNELSGKIDELIERLEQPETDHAVIAEVEDLLAEVKNEMNALESLDDFDQMPGGDAGGLDDEAGGLGDGVGGLGDAPGLGDIPRGGSGGSGTTVNFNISINGEGVKTDGVGEGGGEDEGGGEEDDLAALLGGGEEDEGGGEEDDLAALLGGGGGGEEGKGGGEDELEALLAGESRGRNRTPLTEDSDDPYAYAGRNKAGNKTTSRTTSSVGADYGARPIEIAEDCNRAVQAMIKIANHNDLSGGALLERAEELAVASMRATGILIPERRRDQAVEQLCDAFFDELDRRGVELDEDQYKGPWRHIWGRKKAAINRQERRKGTRSEGRTRRGGRPVAENVGECDERMGSGARPGSQGQHEGGRPPVPSAGGQPGTRRRKGPPKVEWVEEQVDAKKGFFGGVGFIFDHANGQAEPVILSEDGQVEVPIPPALRRSAYAAAEMVDGDPRPFLEWLVNNIEQFRPLSESETAELDTALNEATVKISTNADGGVDIEVDSADPDVTIGDPLDTDMVDDVDPDYSGDAAPGMEPVDAMVPVPGAGDPDGDNEMPDFEGGSDEDESDEDGPPDDDSDDENEDNGPPIDSESDDPDDSDEDDEGVAEDRDVTTPQTRKYNTTKDNHRKDVPVPKPGKSGDKLDGFSGGDGETATPGVKMKKVTPRSGKGKKA